MTASESLLLADDVVPRAIAPVRAQHNLPAPSSGLLGRAGECAQLLKLLRDPACRLLTITAVTGVGKSRLALQAAHDLLQDSQQPALFTHGVFLVTLEEPLPAIEPAELLASAIAGCFGLAFSGPAANTTQVVDFLRERNLLLLLDGAEHLGAGAVFISRLLAEAPALKLLLTARQQLALAGEVLMPLDGLACPPENPNRPLSDYSAVALFTRLACNLNPHLILDDEGLRVVAHI